MNKCRYNQTCALYSKESYTCNNIRNPFSCGKFRFMYEKQHKIRRYGKTL